MKPPTGKYQPLYRHLESLPGDQWTTSFQEVERILGFVLPASARRHSAWWANETVGSHTHSAAWRAAGFGTVDLNLTAERVTFQRH